MTNTEIEYDLVSMRERLSILKELRSAYDEMLEIENAQFLEPDLLDRIQNCFEEIGRIETVLENEQAD